LTWVVLHRKQQGLGYGKTTQDKICDGFGKKFHSKAWWWLVRWSDRAVAEKRGANYTLPILASYTEYLGK